MPTERDAGQLEWPRGTLVYRYVGMEAERRALPTCLYCTVEVFAFLGDHDVALAKLGGLRDPYVTVASGQKASRVCARRAPKPELPAQRRHSLSALENGSPQDHR